MENICTRLFNLVELYCVNCRIMIQLLKLELQLFFHFFLDVLLCKKLVVR